LAKRVAKVDDDPGTQGCDAQSAGGHGMTGDCSGRKDPPDQCDGYKRTVDQMNSDLAHALHAIQDAYVHQYAPWNGGKHLPYVTDHFPGMKHIYNDSWYNEDAEAATERYLRSMGSALNQAAYLPPAPPTCH
jgi:hypothetical protein